MRRHLFLLFAALIAFPQWVEGSYYDHIALPPDEVWEAAQKVLGDQYGIKSAKKDKGTLESGWHHDRVTRSRGLFRGIFKQSYKRRFKLHVNIAMSPEGGSDITVKGTFQEKTAETNANIPWKKAKMNASDHFIEREVFFNLLNELTKKKNAAPPSTYIPLA